MKYVMEPHHKRQITGQLKRFDDRDTGFARGAADGDKYTVMHEKGMENLEKAKPGKTILDHAMWVGARTVDYVLRKNALAREGLPVYNKTSRLRNPDPTALTEIVKEMGRLFGADLVGVAKLNPLWIYTHWGLHNAMYSGAAKEGEPIVIPPEYANVIVMVHEMDYKLLSRTPDEEPSHAIAYSKMAFSASSLATFIRELGYHAIPSGNELGINIPMAIDAGLGELARNGLLMTREFGPRVRICKVFTDLPLVPDSPIDIGVQKFCEKCGRCAKACPSGAIMAGHRTDKAWDRSNAEGVLKWPIHAMKCFEWWIRNGGGCAVCIRVCPWNKPNTMFHKFVRTMAERALFTKFLVFMDELVGYGKQNRGKGFSSIQDPSVTRIGCLQKS